MKNLKTVQYFQNLLIKPNLFYFGQTSNQPPSNNDPNTLSPEAAQSLIEKWVKNNKICLFMKGSPDSPRCGYSRLMVEILKYYGLKNYKHIDVLESPVIREQVRVYSKWPTYPQLFIDGELIGGSDVVKQMHQDESLKKLFNDKKIIE